MWHKVSQVAENFRIEPEALEAFALKNMDKYKIITKWGFAEVSTWNTDDLINDFSYSINTEPPMIIEHNTSGKNREHSDVDALLTSVREWCEEIGTNGQLDVDQDDQLIILTYFHYDGDGADTIAVIIKSDLNALTDHVGDLILQLKACNI